MATMKIDSISADAKIRIKFNVVDKLLYELEYYDDKKFIEDAYNYAAKKRIINTATSKKLNTLVVLFSKLRNPKKYKTVTCRDECEMILSYLNYCLDVADMGAAMKFLDIFEIVGDSDAK